MQTPLLLGCNCCGLILARRACGDDVGLRCARCGHPLSARKPQSLQRTWSFLIASTVLYVPANVLPVMTSTNLFRTTSYTIAGGIGELWHSGSWVLAIIVFIASIVVPIAKIVALALLAITVRLAPRWRRLERAKLYRLVEAVGHWSMLDVYVVVLVGGVVQFGRIANAEPEPGLLAFAAVVMLTMLAARSFDPRRIWDDRDGHG
jgi:paraquat-inducible protein A